MANPLRTAVVPPDPQPVESYIVATNSNPLGSFSWNVYEFEERSVGMVMFSIRPAADSTV